MIVWGGDNVNYLNDGGSYNPSSNSWTAVTTTGAPAGRGYHTAVWTGSQMIVWGGYNGSYLNRRKLQYGERQLDGGYHQRRARRTLPTHGSVDGCRDDRLGWKQQRNLQR